MKLGDFLTRADQLITLADAVLVTQHGSEEWPGRYVDTGRFAEFRAAALSFLRNLYGPDHSYFSDFETKVAHAGPRDTQKGRGILQAVRDELAGGWLRTARGLVAAELFGDFLEMAQYLLAEGYKDSAAVLVGGVLEEHLRQLCSSHGIPVTGQKAGADVPRRADALNADLARAGVYNVLDQKNVTAWLDLRNKAAHSHYAAYTADQVRMAHSGVLEFVARTT